MVQIKIGEKRKFTFKPGKTYILKEIIKNPNITMSWKWSNLVCPHCKNMIENEVEHVIEKAEILVDNSKKENYTNNDILVLGFSTDKKTLLLTQEKANEILLKSKNFKGLVS